MPARNSRITAGRIGEAPTRVLLPWFRGGLGVASEPGTRPGPSPGTRRRCRCDPPGHGRGRGSRVRRPAGACHPSAMKGTAMTIVEDTRVITGGVDTHADLHVVAALDPVGGLLGVREFPAAAAGDASLLGWLSGFGNLALAGVEGTGTGRASPTRWMRSAPRGRRSPGARPGRRKAGTGRWRRSAR